MSIKFFNKITPVASRGKKGTIALGVLLCAAIASINSAMVMKSVFSVDGTVLEEFAQNNILFYDPDECKNSGGYFSDICGETAKEKYWSAIRKHFDAAPAAGIMGNIDHEGGFNPVGVEACTWLNPYNFSQDTWDNGWTWDRFFNNDCSMAGSHSMCPNGGQPTGVGAFGITSGRSAYLHYVNEKAPGLMRYFQQPGIYSFGGCSGLNMNGENTGGDALLKEIGETDYNALVDLEVEWMYKTLEELPDSFFDLDYFSNITDAFSAGGYFAAHYERCAGCSGQAVQSQRGGSAEGEYEEFKDFTCTASSSPKSGSSSVSTNTVSGNDITWIGDSYSVQADNKGLLSGKFPGVDIGPGSNDTSSSYIQGSKFVSSGSSSNPSCLTILQNIIDANKLRPYLVFACGTNGGWSDGDTAKFTEMLKDKDTKAIIVTSKIPGDDYADSNNRLRAMVEANDNIYLADWTSVYNADYFAGDPEKIHPVTDPGYEKWIGIISSALSGASDKGCTTYEGDYPEYLQGDARWGGLDYGGCTMAYCACGASSMAMLATVATGQDIYPNDIADLLGNQYYHSVSVHTLDPIVGEHYGFEVVLDEANSFEETKEKFRKYLKDGYMIHFTGYGCYPGFMHGPGDCSDGHVIGLYDIDENDNVTQANSAYGGNQKSSLDDMANARLWPQFTAIKGNGSSKNTCSDYCSNSKIAINDGLTEGQAKKLAEYYNSPNVDANEYDLPHGKNNCVSFSKWFVEKFTNLKWGGGDGKDVANNLTVENKLTTSTEPEVYAVFSVTSGSIICEDKTPCGHTGIVVAINGDDVMTVEASYPNGPAKIEHHNISYFENTKYNKAFTYLYSSVNQNELKGIVGN